jgi:hypothetical protein
LRLFEAQSSTRQVAPGRKSLDTPSRREYPRMRRGNEGPPVRGPAVAATAESRWARGVRNDWGTSGIGRRSGRLTIERRCHHKKSCRFGADRETGRCGDARGFACDWDSGRETNVGADGGRLGLRIWERFLRSGEIFGGRSARAAAPKPLPWGRRDLGSRAGTPARRCRQASHGNPRIRARPGPPGHDTRRTASAPILAAKALHAPLRLGDQQIFLEGGAAAIVGKLGSAVVALGGFG